ncbi:hypothetical protein ACHAWF_001420 [Thalassiosira exigua]
MNMNHEIERTSHSFTMIPAVCTDDRFRRPLLSLRRSIQPQIAMRIFRASIPMLFACTIAALIPIPRAVASHAFLLPSASSTPPTAFAGFGSASSSAKKSKTKGKKKKIAKGGGVGGKKNNANVNNLFTPESRMDHIKRRIASVDASPIAKLALSKSASGALELGIDRNAIVVVDNFLGEEMITSMRAEAESLLPTLVPSQSTRWDEETQSIVPYEKKGVLSTQIEGGTEGYDKSPRLVEYIVTLTSHLSHKLNSILPESYHLAGDEQTNKLAVCLGDGSYYDKHIDNLGGTASVGDRRKLTALLYVQPPNSHEGQPPYPNESVEDDPRGGYFRAYDVPEDGEVTCIAPRGDRLIMFWSDSLVHDVSPSYAPNGDADRRWALTVWMTADRTSGTIRPSDAEVEENHFGSNAVGKG